MRTLTLLVLLLANSIAFAQNALITEAKKQKIDNYIKHFESHNKLLGTVSIFENGEEVFSKTFGKPNTKSPSVQNRKYAIGSVTKMFSAVLFAKLGEKNKINFNEKLSVYFPSVPNADKISLKQMLNHTSGLKDYVVKNDSLLYWLTEYRSEKEILEEITRQGVAFEPGDSTFYSNSAYYLLGKILEKKYKKSFSQIIQDEITKPYQLKNIVSIDTNNNVNFAKSYNIKEGEWREMEEFYLPNTPAVGNLVSTAKDVNSFLHHLFSYEIITENSLKTMFPQGKDIFGLGFMKVPFYKHIAYGHAGDTYGTHSLTFYDLENKLACTYIINGEDYPENHFAIGLLSIIYGRDYHLPVFNKYTPDKQYYVDYEGTYSGTGLPMAIKIFQEGNELKAQAEGQAAFLLTPKSEHVFEFLPASIEVKFKPDKKILLMKQGRKIFELVKKQRL